MHTDSTSLLDTLAIASTIPWILSPLLLSIVIYRIWRRTGLWSYGTLFTASLMFMLSGILSSLAVNIPRVGKTPDQVAIAKDIQWLHSASNLIMFVFIWVLFISTIGILRHSKQPTAA